MKGKKIMTMLLATMLAGAVLCGCGKETVKESNGTTGKLYPLLTTVVELDTGDDVVYLEDCNGNRWCFEGIEDWQLGDGCNLLMDDNGTPGTIKDDIIISAKYESLEKWYLQKKAN